MWQAVYLTCALFPLLQNKAASFQTTHRDARHRLSTAGWVTRKKHTCLSLFSSKQRRLKMYVNYCFSHPSSSSFSLFLTTLYGWILSFRWSKFRLRSLLHHRPGPSRCRHLGRETEEVSTQPRVCKKKKEMVYYES